MVWTPPRARGAGEQRLSPNPRAGFHDQLPAVSDGMVFSVATDAGLLAIDATTGERAWRRDASRGLALLAGASNGQVVAVVDGQALGLDVRTGHERWRIPTAARWGTSWAMVRGDDLYVVEPSRTFAVELPSGRIRWDTAVGSRQIPALADGVLYLPGADSIVALDTSTGTALWTGAVQSQQRRATPVAGGTVVVTATDGAMVAFPR